MCLEWELSLVSIRFGVCIWMMTGVVMLGLRTWVIWMRDKRIGAILIIAFVVIWGAVIGFTIFSAGEIKCEYLPFFRCWRGMRLYRFESE